ncbi:Methionyl-tRNA formyltransferase [Elasticomyces elasticus]|nr:Methionyl-tRNA formyltransferase [Elasticomyces elasticus]
MLRQVCRLGKPVLSRKYSTVSETKDHDPLNILFCGADKFSIYSLRALHKFQQTRPDKIVSIDVLCRPDKRTGRGLKHVQAVPIKSVATELGLSLHHIDTFKGWQAPSNINLVVAVSFGLLVPGTLLRAAKYGGLNVHPSLLPRFRGAAPIEHTLLERCATTGVTLQTMHPTRFDHGAILSQKTTPITHERRPNEMVELLGPIGADLLVDGIERGLFIPPYPETLTSGHEASYAPKLTPADRNIDWDSWTADDILVRDEVLGGLWDTVSYSRCHGLVRTAAEQRVKFEGPWQILDTVVDHKTSDLRSAGYPVVVGKTNEKVGLCTMDGRIVQPSEITISGKPKGSGHQILSSVLRKSNDQLQYPDGT